MANIRITCVECGAMTDVTVNLVTKAEYEGCVKQGDYSDAEWDAITHYLDTHETRVLREKLCKACQVKADGSEVDWYDLPAWIKGTMDRGDAQLAEAKRLTYYRSEINDGEEIFAAFTAGGTPVLTFFRE